MPRKAKLKVYCTPIGFHDAYVAAPSQKAALEAWGSDANLFARGVAEVVTDPKLTAEPLAHPGQVIKRLRGSAAEQIAALPPTPRRKTRKKPPPEPAEAKKPAPKRRAAKPPPRPSRAPVDAAERAMRDAEARHRSETAALAREEAELDRRRARLRQRHAEEAARLDRALDRARTAYEAALAKWRG
ncbi:MAG TPA: hypothetical protein VFT56_04170 [Sphingomonas sp.]|nr:hypothetical protein [Sphingomonas sp.]